MRRITPRLELDLTEGDLDRIEERAALLLAHVGLGVPLEEARRRLAGIPGVHIRGERVHFSADAILDLLRAKRRGTPAPTSAGLAVSVGGGALNTLDDRTGELRPATTPDLVRALRICDHLGLGGDPPLVPSDISPDLREVALYKLAWEHTRAFGGRDISSIEAGEYVYDMAQAAGKPFGLPLYIISPLRANAENLGLILHFADRLPHLSVGTMPMPGASAPLLAPGYLYQGLAEAIGGYVLLSHLVPKARLSFGMKILAFDLYTSVIGTGSPESLLQGQLEVRLLARYGITPSHFFWSMAGGCDAQAAAERMADVLLGALAGVRHFGVAGRLQGEAFSLEQLLIDLEITAHVERVMRGQAWDEDDTGWLTEATDAIASGTYLGAASTLTNFRQEVSLRPLFDRRTLAQRADMGQPGLHDRLRQRLHELDVPVEPPLSVEARSEMNRIYQHAVVHLDR